MTSLILAGKMSSLLAEPKPSSGAANPRGARDSLVVIPGMRWEDYLAIDGIIGHRATRVTYCHEWIEIMSISPLHESLKSNLRRLIEDACLHFGISISTAGSATRQIPGDRAREPDESFYFRETWTEADFPDLVVEVGLTSGGIDKVDFYHPMRVSEVWVWSNGGIRFFGWQPEGYRELEQSALVPGLKREWVDELASEPNLNRLTGKLRDYLTGPSA